MLNNKDEGEFTEILSKNKIKENKKRCNKKTVNIDDSKLLRRRGQSFSKKNGDKKIKKQKTDEEKVLVSLWMKTVCVGDIFSSLKDYLTDINMIPYGGIDTLWRCLHQEMLRIVSDTYDCVDSDALRAQIYLNEDCRNNDDASLIFLIQKYRFNLTVTSLNKDFQTIEYGDRRTKKIHLLHIGYEYFLALLSEHSDWRYEFSDKEKEILTELNSPLPKSVNSIENKSEKDLLQTLREMFQGTERAQDSIVMPKSNSGKRAYYDIYSMEELDKNKNLKLCTLRFKTAHFAIATIIRKNGEKVNEISILNRKNCGYNTFNGDTVFVEINDKENSTGKVLGVQHSYHKPINTIYLCKVYRDQGSLMSPLDGSFPKIHVDNEPGRRQYETDLQQKTRKLFTKQQRSAEFERFENSNYADNIYVSIYKVKYDSVKKTAELFDPRVEPFDPETCDKLFLVCYEYWDISNMYPNGKVVGMISTYDSFKDSLHLIQPLCNIEPAVINDTYKKEMKAIKTKVKTDESLTLPHDIVPDGAMVFTIDNEDTKDMDDALSYHIKDDLIIVGVHITDVTKYISPQHEIYKQAHRRFATAYTPNQLGVDPVYLIEKSLSTEVLSLVPFQPRAVLSVMFHFTRTAPHVRRNVSFAETVIKSKYKLNYRQVEGWLLARETPLDVEEDLLIAIKGCHEIAKEIRRARLRDSYFVRQSNSNNPNFQFDDSFNAHFLIEEFMLMANEEVAKKIYETYPNMSLIRVQEPVSDYTEWLERLFTNTNTRFPSSLKQYCNLLNIRRISDNTHDLIVSLQYYTDFVRYLNEDINKARNMLQYDEYINDIFVHITEWYDISHSARYQCSIEGSVDNRHFSLDKDIYTHFTSPIRRFSDVIVHRLLKSIINPSLSIDSINSSTIEEFCIVANKCLKNNRTFEKCCAPYAIFESSPIVYNFVLDCACINITTEELQFAHPTLERVSSVKHIKFVHLSLESSPVELDLKEPARFCDLTWKKIIYSSEFNNNSNTLYVINSHIYDAVLPKSACQLFKEIRRSYLSVQDLAERLRELGGKFQVNRTTNNFISSDASSNPIIEINLKISIKNTLRIQFCGYKVNGLKRVNPELLIINPSFQLCLIHQEDPVMCFIPGGKINFKNNSILWQFYSFRQYANYFNPLIELESLREMMSERSQFTFLDVSMEWLKVHSSVTNKKETFGIIKYSIALCESRHIDFTDELEEIETDFSEILAKCVYSGHGDLVCIRGKMKNADTYWVAHGNLIYVGNYQESGSEKKIKLLAVMLTQWDFDIFTKEFEDMSFVVEFFQRSISSVRQMNAVSLIEKSEFLKDVVLGRKMKSSQDDKEMLPHLLEELYKVKADRLNVSQRKAITKAMNEKLSLIWGPPGTGKTTIGCILAYCYCIRNKNDGIVLYCGPSNECVNLIIHAMTSQFKTNCPKMLRIFSKQQELADFPLPGYFTNATPLLPSLREKSLHFLIRQDGSKYAHEIGEYDLEFHNILNSPNAVRKFGTSIHQIIKDYYKLIHKAKQDHISNTEYNMILCTTSVSGSKIMRDFDIRQIIIDEAGMCKEPETLIPIAMGAQSVHNVVLIGDHKQLRPIILDNFAGKRGLQISLFERYQLLRPELITMLNQQYRMHPSICEFPSSYFYAGELYTVPSPKWSGLHPRDFVDTVKYASWNGVDYHLVKPNYKECLKTSGYNAIPDLDWPGQRGVPYRSFEAKFAYCPERLVFINIVGDEITHTISTSKCGQNSKGNYAEVYAVGHVYDRLVARFSPAKVAVEHITVLTQYRLQEEEIRKQCTNKLLLQKIDAEPIVKTVIKSQGSENDYIIFSTVRSLRNQSDIIQDPSPGWENRYLGFITDPNQVNVALTRARKGLIMIGNKHLLSVNKIWKNLLNDLQGRGCILENCMDFL